MNKITKSIMTLILAFTLICITGVVKADTTTGALALVAETNQHPGDTFTVAVNFSNLQTDEKASFGINGKIEYDTEKLDFVSVTTNTDGGWDTVGPNTFNESKMSYWFENTFGKGNIGANSNIFTLTFKVKDGAKGDAVVKVNVSEVTHNSNFPGASTTIKITEKAQENPPAQNPSTENPPAENPPVENPPKTDATQEGNKPEQTQTPSGSQGTQQKTEDTGKKDKTTSSGKLPQTGENYIIWAGITVCGVAAVTTLYKYRKEILKANRK